MRRIYFDGGTWKAKLVIIDLDMPKFIIKRLRHKERDRGEITASLMESFAFSQALLHARSTAEPDEELVFVTDSLHLAQVTENVLVEGFEFKQDRKKISHSILNIIKLIDMIPNEIQITAVEREHNIAGQVLERIRYRGNRSARKWHKLAVFKKAKGVQGRT
ncbi:MAG: hypothetical protein KGI33_11925 [Thaumarchaeota archaeon]|nr:hypothetical protein [Nitrososphaerota archaeon]